MSTCSSVNVGQNAQWDGLMVPINMAFFVEGQFLAVVAPEYADAALEALQQAPGGHESRIIGEVREQPACAVLSSTPYGGTRIVDMLVGDPLPRIC